MNQSELVYYGGDLPLPAYRRTGARITYIAGDLREVRIKLQLNWKIRNYVGTIFGGRQVRGCRSNLHDDYVYKIFLDFEVNFTLL